LGLIKCSDGGLDSSLLLKRAQAHPPCPVIVGRRVGSPILAHDVFKEPGNVLDLHLPIPISARVNENVGSPSIQCCQVVLVGD